MPINVKPHYPHSGITTSNAASFGPKGGAFDPTGDGEGIRDCAQYWPHLFFLVIIWAVPGSHNTTI